MLEGIGDFLGGIGDFATDVIGQVATVQDAYDQMRGRNDTTVATIPTTTTQPAYNPTIDLNISPSDIFAQPNWYLVAVAGAAALGAIYLIKK